MQPGDVEVDRLAIMRREQREADRLAAMPLLQQLMDREVVAERLRHLGAVHLHEAVVQPVPRERPNDRSLRSGFR